MIVKYHVRNPWNDEETSIRIRSDVGETFQKMYLFRAIIIIQNKFIIYIRITILCVRKTRVLSTKNSSLKHDSKKCCKGQIKPSLCVKTNHVWHKIKTIRGCFVCASQIYIFKGLRRPFYFEFDIVKQKGPIWSGVYDLI